MITHLGWSCQLYLGQLKLLPFDVQVDTTTVYASFSAPSHSLPVGSEWTLIWRDDRVKNPPNQVLGDTTTVVGLVSESEGTGNSSSSTLVGSSLSPPTSLQILPNVKGIIRKIELSLNCESVTD